MNSPKSSRIDCKADDGAKKPELHDGGDVPEELLSSHVVAGGEHDGWQNQVEEEILVELEALEYGGTAAALGFQEDAPRAEDSDDYHHAGVVAE